MADRYTYLPLIGPVHNFDLERRGSVPDMGPSEVGGDFSGGSRNRRMCVADTRPVKILAKR